MAFSIRRLENVMGSEGKCNNLLVRHSSPIINNDEDGKLVVFFPGDVQNFRNEMLLAGPQMSDYVEFCYENTMEILASKYPNSNIFVIQPSKFYQRAFAGFDNFIQNSNMFGAALEYVAQGNKALQHLKLLLDAVCRILEEGKDSRKGSNFLPNASGGCRGNVPLCIVGFSKGGIVLSQIVTELISSINENSKTTSNDYMSPYQIREFHWLDAGNGSLRNTFPSIACSYATQTEQYRVLLERIKFHLHGTPYQLKCKKRPWIEQEFYQFFDQLSTISGGVMHVCKQIYFEDTSTMAKKEGEISIETHFKILSEFQCLNF